MKDTTNPILLSSVTMDSNVPLYYQLVSIIKRNIAVGIIKSGDLLPSEQEMCDTFGISRSTVRLAIGELESEGLVVRRRGKGTYISEPKLRRKTEEIYSFSSEMLSLGLNPSSKVLRFEKKVPEEDMVKFLGLKDNMQQVFEIVRVRMADNEPLLLETTFIPEYIFPELTEEMLNHASLYQLIKEKARIRPFSAEESYETIVLTKDVADLLNTKRGSSAFYVERRTWTMTGEMYELTQSILRGDRSKFIVRLYENGVTFNRDAQKLKTTEV